MDGSRTTPRWIAVDWGTTHLRAWAMSGDNQIMAQATSDKGMGRLSPDAFEPALLDLITPWLDGAQVVMACGMVGSRQGWVEAPYAATPCTLDALKTVQAPTSDPRLDVRIIAGVRQDDPADVMRGEETQIAGFIRLNPDWDGVLCLPGTHTKWVHISAGEIVSFQTFMTGEMFALLSEASVLRHSVGAGWEAEAFETAVTEMMSRPEALAAKLFNLRAQGLLQDLPGAAATARLSGLLIGAELAAARPYWLGQQVAIIGAEKLSTHYQAALQAQGVPATDTDATEMTLSGLASAFMQMEFS